MIERGKGLGKRFRVGGKGNVEFLELGLDDFGHCRDFKAIVGGMIGYIPGSVKDSAKDFGLETLHAFDVGHNSTPYVHVSLRMAL